MIRLPLMAAVLELLARWPRAVPLPQVWLAPTPVMVA